MKFHRALYIQIVERIKRWMREGGLKEGDQLPSERELAQMFGTSRVPVREALKILEFLAAVQHVRGKGVFVRKAKVSHIFNNIDFIATDAMETLMELLETRPSLKSKLLIWPPSGAQTPIFQNGNGDFRNGAKHQVWSWRSCLSFHAISRLK